MAQTLNLPGKAFLKVVAKEANRYATLFPWLAMVKGRWHFCATNGRAAVMHPVSVAAHATEHLPEAAKIAIPTECFKEGEPVEVVEAESKGSYRIVSRSGTIRPCPEVAPPDLDGMMRDRSYVSDDRMDVIVDAKVMMDALEALLCELKGKDWGTVRSFVKMSFARKAGAEGSGEADDIDDCAPIVLEVEMMDGGAPSMALVMPVSGNGKEPKKKKAARGASVGASAGTSPSSNVEAEERVAMAKEGGMNA